MRKIIIMLFPVLLFISCKADEIEISVNSEEIKNAISGEEIFVEFEATMSLWDDDDETKAHISKIEEIIDTYIQLEEFEISTGSFGLEISIEGEIPISRSPVGVTSPWMLLIEENDQEGALADYQYSMKFIETENFTSFMNELYDVNFMLSPDVRQPIKLKIKNSGASRMKVFSSAVEVDGEHFAFYEADIEKRTILNMAGGAYDHVPQIVFLSFLD